MASRSSGTSTRSGLPAPMSSTPLPGTRTQGSRSSTRRPTLSLSGSPTLLGKCKARVARFNAKSLTLAPTDQMRMHKVYRSASTLRKRTSSPTSSAPIRSRLDSGGACLKANAEASTRAHAHCVAAFLNRRSGFAGFRKPGVSVYIQLDAPKMLLDDSSLYPFATGVLLIPQTVDPKYFLWFNAMPDNSWQGRCPPPSLVMVQHASQ